MTIATTLNNDVRLGIQVVVDGEKIEIERAAYALGQFLHLLIPAMIALIHLSDATAIFFETLTDFFEGFKQPIPPIIAAQDVSANGFLIFIKVVPMLTIIFGGALIYGLNPVSG